jgi:hypothetical protein
MWSSILALVQLCLGAPRSHQRTWVDQDGAKPHQSSDNLSPKQILGAPYLARFWRDVGFHRSLPENLPRIKAEDGEPDLCVSGMECFFSESRMQFINATGLHSGGICNAPCGSLQSFPEDESPIKPLPPTRFRNPGRQQSFVQQNQPHRFDQPANLDSSGVNCFRSGCDHHP